MMELESAFFELMDPAAPTVAVLGENVLRLMARDLAEAARDAVSGVVRLSECDVAMRGILRRRGYPPELVKDASRRMVEYVA